MIWVIHPALVLLLLRIIRSVFGTSDIRIMTELVWLVHQARDSGSTLLPYFSDVAATKVRASRPLPSCPRFAIQICKTRAPASLVLTSIQFTSVLLPIARSHIPITETTNSTLRNFIQVKTLHHAFHSQVSFLSPTGSCARAR